MSGLFFGRSGTEELVAGGRHFGSAGNTGPVTAQPGAAGSTVNLAVTAKMLVNRAGQVGRRLVRSFRRALSYLTQNQHAGRYFPSPASLPALPSNPRADILIIKTQKQ